MIKKTKTLEHKDVKKTPMEEVRTALKELVSEQKKNNNQDDRAAFMQVGRFDYVRLLQEIRCYEKTSDSETFSDKSRDTESEAEFVTATGSEREEENGVKRSVESKQSEETTSSSGEEDIEIEKRKRTAIRKRKNRKKRILKEKEELDHLSSTNESSTESMNLNSTDDEDYSDEDHVLLVTSIANLRRRENMKLKPLRTKSKKAPTFKEDTEKEEKNPTFWSLNTTKKVIQKHMERDERKIQNRDSKKKLISEEKWSEGTNWNDLVKEGAETERVFIAKAEKEREAMADKALQIMVPGTEVIEPVIPPQPLPAGFHKRTYGPKQGGPIFDELLKISTQMHDLVNASERNIALLALEEVFLIWKNTSCE